MEQPCTIVDAVREIHPQEQIKDELRSIYKLTSNGRSAYTVKSKPNLGEFGQLLSEIVQFVHLTFRTLVLGDDTMSHWVSI